MANALAALEAGATHVQGTINGYGERTGNCNLTSLIPNIVFKMGKTCVPAASLRRLKELSQFVDEIANFRHNPRQPWVGSAAFSHKGRHARQRGAKTGAQLRAHRSGLRGQHAHVLISDLAGRSNIVMKARELGIHLAKDAPELREIWRGSRRWNTRL